MKNLLVTGSNRGIGKAIAKLAHQKGYKVIVHGKTDSKTLQAVHKELDGSVKTFFDIASKQATHAAIEKVIQEVGPIDALVNNAGLAINYLHDISEVDDQKAVEEFNINILGTIHCIQAVLPGMLDKGVGSVVNVSSIKGYPQLSTMSSLTYATTKAGIISMTKALAKTYPTVRFNVIAPGWIATDQVKDWQKADYERVEKQIIMGRLGTPEEIANLALFLASDEASYITGADFLIDGGFMLQGK